jgi:type VI secretion system protein
MMPRLYSRAYLLSLVLAASLCACSMFGPSKYTALRQIQVIAPGDANQNTATAIDLVFVYDQPAMAVLPLSGPQWFANKAPLSTTLLNRIDVVSIQLQPSSLVDPVALPAHYKKALAVYSFVNFIAPAGQGRADLTLFKQAVITLGPDTVTYSGTR